MAITKQICVDGSNSPDIYYALSTDTKPTENIKNPSLLFEKNTSQWYVFNEETRTWQITNMRGGTI